MLVSLVDLQVYPFGLSCRNISPLTGKVLKWTLTTHLCLAGVEVIM